MNAAQMLKAFQEYYGLQYRPPVARVVMQYLDKLSLGPKMMSRLYAEVLKTVSGKWGKLPDVAMLQEVWANLKGDLQHEVPPIENALPAPEESDMTQEQREAAAAWLHELMIAISRGEDPRESERVKNARERLSV